MASPAISSRATRTHWNSLEVLRAGRAVLLVLDALLLVAVVIAAQVHRAAVKTIGRDAAPSIIAAQQIKSALAAMDADAAADLLRPAAAADDAAAYEQHRVEAADALLAATENITYGNAERDPIRTMQLGMGTYEQRIQHARDLRPLGAPAMLAAYRAAATEMDTALLPAAEALDQANNSVLERSYAGEATRSSVTRLLVVLAGAFAACTLLGFQIYLSQKVRRTFNPMLLAATLLVIALAAFVSDALTVGQQQMQVADEDAFASIHSVWRAQAAANQAESEEERSLLDPATAAASQQVFAGLAGAVLTQPENVPPELLVKLVHSGARVDGLRGYLGQEVNHVHFTGERDQLAEALMDWERFLADAARVQRFEQQGQHRQAVDLELGDEMAAFARFDHALGATRAIDQAAFERAIANSFSALSGLEAEAAVAAAIIAGLIAWGFAARIAEYK